MNDPVLDRRLDNCKELMLVWRKFHDYLNDCIKGKEFSSQDEADFLKLKSQIAILHDSFLEAVETKQLSTARGMIDVVERCILLRQVIKMNAAEIKKMEIEWHESYLLLNETIGFVQDEIDRMAKVSRVVFETRKTVDKTFSTISRIATNRTLHFVLGASAVIAVLVIMPMMGVFSYDFLTKYPITNKLYSVSRGLLRGSVMKELEFLEWDDYKTHYRQDMPGGYNADNVPSNQKSNMIRSFSARSYPGLDPFDIEPEIKKASFTEVEKFNKDGAEIFMFFAMFKKTGEAKAAAAKYNDWRAKIPENSTADQQEKLMQVGNINNIFYTIWTRNPGLIEPIILTLRPK